MKADPFAAPTLHIHTEAPAAAPRMNYIFIDYENVQVSDLSKVRHQNIRLVIVVGEKQKNIPLTFIEFLQAHPGQLEIVKTPRQGKNALDFVLASKIGETIALDSVAYIHIISKDQGFDALVAHLKSQKRLAARHASLSEVPILFNTRERLDRLKAHLKDPSRSRPRKRTTLENTIQQHFDKSLSADGVEKTIKLLVDEKILTISQEGKIDYPR